MMLEAGVTSCLWSPPTAWPVCVRPPVCADGVISLDPGKAQDKSPCVVIEASEGALESV